MPRAAHSPLPTPLFNEPVFNEDVPLPDPAGFITPHPSDNAVYAQIQQLLYKDVVGFAPSRLPPDGLFTLESAYGVHGPQVIQQITQAGRIAFHCMGDSGASNATYFNTEIRVTDQVVADAHASVGGDRPAFLYHLGDVVYNFGETKYYYDQFYEPFRNYPAPIFAIPGNHDSFIVPGTPPDQTPLSVFERNFCATEPAITPEAGSLHRTASIQPGVYFTLDAPFVRIIGLFSNALEDPGVISSQGGTWKAVPDIQLDFLAAQLKLIKSQNYAGAVLLAVHHPPFSYVPPKGGGGAGGLHGGSPALLRQIDTICRAQGVYPHAVLSGHAHNYQRYTRVVKLGGGHQYDVPFIICGDGGHHVNPLVQGKGGQPGVEPLPGTRVDYMDIKPAIDVGGLVLEKFDDQNYGYLRVGADAKNLHIGFYQVGTGSLSQARFDLVTIDLASHRKVAN